jgi:hypothetical protein
LPDDERLKYYDRICWYGIDWIDEKVEWFAENMFVLVKPQLDSNNKRYSVGNLQWHHWVKGWRPKKNPTGVKKWNPKQTPNVNVNVNDNVNDITMWDFVSAEELFEKWNKQQHFKKCRAITDDIRKAWKKIISKYTRDDCRVALNNYRNEINSRRPKVWDTYFEHRFSLYEFITNKKWFVKFYNQ